MANYLRKVNRTKIEPALLGEAMQMHANMPAEDRTSFEARTFRIIEMLNERGLQAERATLLLAIDFRLTALSRLIEARGGLGFTRPGSETGMDWVHADLVRCAAEEPIIEDAAKQPAFDPVRFEQRLLAICEPQGEA
ncbi:hypothetical protein BH11PSE6_BH11PSE6_25920 [soil metagenome]